MVLILCLYIFVYTHLHNTDDAYVAHLKGFYQIKILNSQNCLFIILRVTDLTI